jgi:hypothetical protein
MTDDPKLTEPTAMALVEDVAGFLRETGFDSLIGKYFTPLARTNPGDKAAVFGLLQAEGTPVDSILGQRIKIVTFLFRPATFVSDGEEVTTLMSKLKLSDGKIVTTHSAVIPRQLFEAVAMLGWPSEQNPYEVTIQRRVTKPPRSAFMLEFHLPEQPARKMGGKQS